MAEYSYPEAVEADVLTFLESDVNLADYESREDLEEELADSSALEDAATGNLSGSYTFSTWQAAQYLAAGNWDILADAMDELSGDYQRAIESPEYADVLVRYYCLPGAISDALDEYRDEEGRDIDEAIEAAKPSAEDEEAMA